MGKGVIWGLHLFSLKAPVSWDPSELVRLLSVHLILIAFGIQAFRGLQRSCVDTCHGNTLW